MKQYAPACERNRQPILEVLAPLLKETATVLEIGSGTGQHAAWFSEHMPHLAWQPSDQPGTVASIEAWRERSGAVNLRKPLEIDLLNKKTWPQESCGALVCINTVHIVSWQGVKALFDLAEKVLETGGVLYLYGPFRYANRPLEPSNEQFDQWLKQRDPQSGIRDFEAVDALARAAGLDLEGDVPMPANNRSLWWRKSA